MTPEDVLGYWFGPPGAAARWWEKDPAFDAELRERFLVLHAAIVSGEHDDWKSTARGSLAYIVVIDQFSRNMFRGTKDAFAYDILAQTATLAGMRAGIDRTLESFERLFFYMPLVHAEDRQLQDQAVITFATLAECTPEMERGPILKQVIWSAKHRNIVVRFGRFPHRNAILGRASTREEIAFLKEPGSSF